MGRMTVTTDAGRPARIPEPTIRRLPLYLRVLADLERGGGRTISSKELATLCRVSPAQIRKDLSHFGSLGRRGVGYDVNGLRSELERILGLDRPSALVIVGAGNLGSALGNYAGFAGRGFEIVALFDTDARKVGRTTRAGKPVLHMDRLADEVRRHDARIAIVAVPAEGAQPVVDRLVAAGVTAILNFAPTLPQAPEGVRIRHVDLRIELEGLAFLSIRNEPGREERRHPARSDDGTRPGGRGDAARSRGNDERRHPRRG